jgi:ubiquinone biosynthesis protein
MTWLLDIALAVGLVVLLKPATERLLAVRLGITAAFTCGLAGVGIGALFANALITGGGRPSSFAALVVFSLLGTLVAVALLRLLARPETLAKLEPARGVPHPLGSLRRRIDRTRRYVQVLRIPARNGLGAYFGRDHVHNEGLREIGIRRRQTLEASGGIFVKLGQALSTRSDLLPAEIVGELARLQDQVAPAPAPAVLALLKQELGAPPHKLFAHFEPTPVAAASIAQVHRARLDSDETVAVKVQRPGIAGLVARDLDIILRLASNAEERTSWGRKIQVTSLARGFATNLRQELDFRTEARNTKAVAEVLGADHALRVPAVYQTLSTQRVLVLQWLDGSRLRDAAPQLEQLSIDRAAIARSLLRSFLGQILDAGLFHADPHPGNVLVRRDGTLALLDFGSIGRLDSLQRSGLRQTVLALARRNPALLTDGLLALSPCEDIDSGALERALAQFISLRLGPGVEAGVEILHELLLVTLDFGLTFDPELAGVFRTLATLDGTLHALDPGFHSVEEAKRLVARQALAPPSATGLGEDVADDIAALLAAVRRLPRRLDHLSAAAERGQLTLRLRLFSKRDTELVRTLTAQFILAFFSASIGLVSALLLTIGGGLRIGGHLTVYQLIGALGLAAATVLGLRVVVAVTRDAP